MPNNYNKTAPVAAPFNGSRPHTSERTAQIFINGRPATARITTTERMTHQSPAVVVHAGLVLDASGSMRCAADNGSSKTKMDVALDSLWDMFKQVLKPEDRCTVSFFDEKYRQVFYNTKVSVLAAQRARLRDEAQKLMGCTALYDATMRALASMQATKEAKDAFGNTVLNNLIIFTDGGDNSSKSCTMKQMIAALMQPGLSNFHATIIAVGSDAKRSADNMRAEIVTYRGKNHVHVITTDKIADGFGQSNKRLRKAIKLLEETITFGLVQRGNAVQHGALGSVAGSLLGGHGYGKERGLPAARPAPACAGGAPYKPGRPRY